VSLCTNTCPQYYCYCCHSSCTLPVSH
jgi:hypothetical protein